jgi:hypothetical protein
MTRNEAIASIANKAITHIHQFAFEAMQMLKEGTPSIETPASVALAQPVTRSETPASVAVEQPPTRRGRPPRKAETEAAPTAPVEVQPEEAEAPTQEDTQTEEGTTDTQPTVFRFGDAEFPNYPDSWFDKENLETARSHCRALISIRLKQTENDVDGTKEEMATLTKKARVSDFGPDECRIYYQAVTKLLGEDEFA